MNAESAAPPGRKGRFEGVAAAFYEIATRMQHKCTMNVPLVW